MPSTNETPQINGFWDKVISMFIDKGLTFVILGIVVWVFYSWYNESRIEQRKEMDEMREMIKDCASSRKEQLQLEVEQIHLKVDELLIRISNRNQ